MAFMPLALFMAVAFMAVGSAAVLSALPGGTGAMDGTAIMATDMVGMGMVGTAMDGVGSVLPSEDGRIGAGAIPTTGIRRHTDIIHHLITATMRLPTPPSGITSGTMNRWCTITRNDSLGRHPH